MGALTAAALGISAALPSAFPQSLNASFEGGNSASLHRPPTDCSHRAMPAALLPLTCCPAALPLLLPCGLEMPESEPKVALKQP